MSRAALAALVVLGLGAAGPGPLPRSQLAVRADDAWRVWWRSDSAPAVWRGADHRLTDAVRFTPAAPGVEWAEVRLAGAGEAWRMGLVVVRLDPARLRLALEARPRADGFGGRWRADAVADDVVLAANAGQFSGARPWGWLVRGGRELQTPGFGPAALAVVVDTAGAVHWVGPDSIAAWRPDADRGRAEGRAGGAVREAFQSYPALLVGDGDVPAPLRAAGGGVDVAHRDARLALGETRDGRLLLVLTRFQGLGDAAELLPFGLTTPEMAAVMGALGARRAVALDGGLSAQLSLRDAAGGRHAWRGLRPVPLGLVVRRR
ncbi:MAG TPA: phosphodiester glycosidase family protein [Gemmatimonadales bacterium]|nr:phosphodiester glycosidase family protein [Gemmatimonadales bacterium]